MCLDKVLLQISEDIKSMLFTVHVKVVSRHHPIRQHPLARLLYLLSLQVFFLPSNCVCNPKTYQKNDVFLLHCIRCGCGVPAYEVG